MSRRYSLGLCRASATSAAACALSRLGRTIEDVPFAAILRWFSALALACVLLRSAKAQQAYTTRLWQTQDGLPQQTVQAVAQTPDGFLWIGTTGGLLRFDGARFLAFDRGNTPALQENSVFSLTTGRDGSLWIGTEGGGLVRMKEGAFRHFGAPDGLLDGFVRAVLEDRAGTVWIGTDNGLFQLANAEATHATRVDATPTLPAMAVHALAETVDGRVWAGGSRLFALRGGRAQEYDLVGQYSETRVKSILPAKDGTLWVGTVSGVQRLPPAASRFERLPGIQATARTLREAADGTFWIGTIGQGAYTVRAGKLAAVQAAGPEALRLPSKTVLSLFEDTERNLWMGTQAGVLRFSRSLVQLVALPNAADSDFETIALDRDSLWVAGTRLSHLVHGLAIPTAFPRLHGARVRNVFRAADGTLWIGTDGRGLFHLDRSGAATQYTTANGLVNNFVRGILQARDGDLWIATDEGLSRLSGGTLHNLTVREGLVYFSVRALLEDRSGDLWIGTDRGLSHLAGGRFVQDAATRALDGEKVWALHQSDSGALWFGTRDDGLFRLAPGVAALTHFTTEQGLPGNSAFALLEDKQRRLWIGGANGISVLSIADLERRATDPHAFLSQRFFAVSQGGELSPLYGGTMPAGAITPDGDVWFPTSKGPVHLHADAAGSSAVPQVFLDQIVADGRTLSPQVGPILLPANNRSLELSYGSILLGPQDAVQVQYRLEGFDPYWRYGSNRRVAVYTNLPAGRYTFHVRAFQGASGTLTERSLTLIKQQYFFRTGWFLTLCVVLLILAVWGGHRLKLRRVRLAFEAVLEERARLAREMHDTLIQGCAGVSLLLEACSAEASANPAPNRGTGQSELLDYARTQLAASIDEAREAVWNLRGQHSADFRDVLQQLARRIDRGSAIAVECTVDGDPYDFHAAAMHEIAMASREAIYNALLHAAPTRIVVHATFAPDQFSLAVEDDGSGFIPTDHAPDGHFGLAGIQERIRRLGGSVRVTSAPHQGTRVLLQVPRAAVCFARNQAKAERPPVEELV